MATILIVDCNYLAHRAFYSTGDLSHNGQSTGVSFGVLRDLENFTELFSASIVVMCFDHFRSLREEILPCYKETRKKKAATETEEVQAAKREMYREVQELREIVFPQMGYKNIFWEDGYEADDIIAQVAKNTPIGDDSVIVSSDNDLLQCLQDNVVVYSPKSKKVTTERSFYSEWGLMPDQWPSVKALAGCGTDDVPGIDGIGEVTAAKWFRQELKPTSKAYQKIEANIHVYAQNIDLVRLPFAGMRKLKLVSDETTPAKIEKAKTDLGIRTRRATPQPTGGFDL